MAKGGFEVLGSVARVQNVFRCSSVLNRVQNEICNWMNIHAWSLDKLASSFNPFHFWNPWKSNFSLLNLKSKKLYFGLEWVFLILVLCSFILKRLFFSCFKTSKLIWNIKHVFWDVPKFKSVSKHFKGQKAFKAKEGQNPERFVSNTCLQL